MEYKIYLITNLITGKLYVGQTDTTINQRFNQHVREANRHDNTCYLHNSILKYGPDNFTIKLIEDNIPEDLIDEKESHYIDEVYHTFYLEGNGYNMTHGGQGVHGYQHSEETKKKISDSSKAKWASLKENNPDEYKRLCEIRSINHKGWKPSKQTLQNMRDSAYKRDGELNPFYGKSHSEEVKQHLSDIKSVPIQMLDLDGNLVMEFKSGKEASIYLFNHKDEFINISATSPTTLHARIGQVLRGKAKTAYGYKWKIKCID